MQPQRRRGRPRARVARSRTPGQDLLEDVAHTRRAGPGASAGREDPRMALVPDCLVCRPFLRQAGIAVRSTPAAKSWRFDPEALGRALDNLIDNSFGLHAQRRSSIEVRVSTDAQMASLLVTVSDHGALGWGLEVAATASSEQRSFPAARTILGLGLALAREIATGARSQPSSCPATFLHASSYRSHGTRPDRGLRRSVSREPG